MNGTFKKPAARTYGKKTKFNKFGMLPEDSPVAVKKSAATEQGADGTEESKDDAEVEKVMKDLYGKKAEEGPSHLETRGPEESMPVTLSNESHETGTHSPSEEPAASDISTRDEPSGLPETAKKPAATVVIANTQDTLGDITSVLDTLKISKPAPLPTAPSPRRAASTARKTRGSSRTASKPSPIDKRLEWLMPLLDAYEGNGNPRPCIKEWESVLDPSWSLLKIAESSYAEVYKVTNPSGTSILKVMALKPPSGPGSRRETACTVESVISEVLIMDLMADIPGYLVFRDMHLISGKPPDSVVAAWEAHDWGVSLLDDDGEETNEGEANSTFPHPAKYNKDAVFLVLELGDAGVDVEHYVVKTMAEFWDIFLGITIALATGESWCGFEHRDLHEGNVCVKRVRQPRPSPEDSKHKFGYSGLEVIILDYTLSRAENIHTGEILAFNLEENQELFYESDMLQHQMYRRMKNWVFFRQQGLTHPLLDDVDTSWDKELSWKDFHPFTNVIWIYYELNFLLKEFKGSKEDKEKFKEETKELRERIDPDRRAFEGGFKSAEEIRSYCVQKGWIQEADTNDMLDDDEEQRVFKKE